MKNRFGYDENGQLEWICDIGHYIECKSAPSPPQAPNPASVAQAQGAADINTAIAQGIMNHTTQVTPYGTNAYTQTGTQDVNGNAVPQYQQTVSLTPQQQALFNTQQQTQQGLANAGQQALGNLNLSPLNFSSLPQFASNINTQGLQPIPTAGQFTQDANNAAQNVYGSEFSLVNPFLQQQQESLNASLANQGIGQGSEAYNNAQTQLGAQQATQLNSLAQGAVGQGYQVQNQLYNQALAGQGQGFGQAQAQASQADLARQQGISEQTLQQNQPINVLSAILQGNPAAGTPSFPASTQTGVAPTDVLGAYGLQQSGANALYGAQAAQQSGLYGGLGSLGGGALAGLGKYLAA